MSDEEKVYVGSKPILAYVTAIITSFSRSDTVKVMARGRAISSAVDVVEVTKRSFMNNLVVDGIEIGTERLEGERGERNVSTITIKLSRPKK
jgi:DNA-binding protein Alba